MDLTPDDINGIRQLYATNTGGSYPQPVITSFTLSAVTFPITAGAGYEIAIYGNGGVGGPIGIKRNTGNSPSASNLEPPDGYVPPATYQDPTYPPGVSQP